MDALGDFPGQVYLLRVASAYRGCGAVFKFGRTTDFTRRIKEHVALQARGARSRTYLSWDAQPVTMAVLPVTKARAAEDAVRAALRRIAAPCADYGHEYVQHPDGPTVLACMQAAVAPFALGAAAATDPQRAYSYACLPFRHGGFAPVAMAAPDSSPEADVEAESEPDSYAGCAAGSGHALEIALPDKENANAMSCEDDDDDNRILARLRADPAYVAMRESWEREYFYLEESDEYVYTVPCGLGYARLSRSTVLGAFGCKTFRATALGGEWAKFINIWIDDPGKRSYSRIAFAPPPVACPAREWNAWPGLAAERLTAVEPDAEGFAAFLELARVVAGGSDGALRHLLSWAADLVQRPGRRPAGAAGAAVVLSSPLDGTGQDTGQDMFANFLVFKLLGFPIAIPRWIFDPKHDLPALLFDSEHRTNRSMFHLRLGAAELTSQALATHLGDLVASAGASPCRYLVTVTTKHVIKADRRLAVFEADASRGKDFDFWDRTADLLSRDGTAVAVLRALSAQPFDPAALT